MVPHEMPKGSFLQAPGCDGAVGEAGERLAAGWLDSLLSQTSVNNCNQVGGTRPAP